jgi:hypothetical protein
VFVLVVQVTRREDRLHQRYRKPDELVLADVFKKERPAVREAAMREARERFDDALRSRAPLPPALRGQGLEEDMLQNTWELVLRAGPGGYQPDRGSVLAYLEGHARNARRNVCQEHAPPGMRRRPGKDAQGKPVEWQPAVSLDATVAVGVAEMIAPVLLVEVLAVDEPGFDRALDRVYLGQLEKDAAVSQPLVSDLIAWMRHDRGLADAAAQLGISRHAARRALDQYASTLAA